MTVGDSQIILALEQCDSGRIVQFKSVALKTTSCFSAVTGQLSGKLLISASNFSRQSQRFVSVTNLLFLATSRLQFEPAVL